MLTSHRSAVPLATACFFLSGVAALLYEVVWMRLLAVAFGHTVYAVTTVLAAYMGGLALGSILAGKWADRLRRPLRTYGVLEAAIGLYCGLSPLLFGAVDGLYLRLYRVLEPGPLEAGALQFLLSAALLLPPTALMGATLPILSRVVVESSPVAGSRVGTLYAVNTWGAVVGTAATGFLLLPSLGLRNTVWVGVGINRSWHPWRWPAAGHRPNLPFRWRPSSPPPGPESAPEPGRLQTTSRWWRSGFALPP